MPPRIPDHKRAAILADIQAGNHGNREIARTHGVSPSTVTKLAKDANVANAFERSRTEKATRAAVADSRAERARLAALLLGDVERLRNRAWQPYSYYERGMEGPELVTLDQPPLRETREAYTALAIAIDKHLALDKHDAADPGTMGSLLGSLLDRLQDTHGTGNA